MLLGYYDIVFDRSTEEIEVIPVRNSDLHLNITNVINATLGLGITLIPGESNVAEGLISFDMSLTHPFPLNPEFTAFDMKGIIMSPGSMNVGGLIFADHNESRVENADGYTRWWNPAEFTTPGVFGYSQGLIANGTPAQLTATVNPYKLFADVLQPTDSLSPVSAEPLGNPQGRAVFTAGSTNTRRYRMRFEMNPDIQIIFGYAIDVCWDLPSPNPPADIPNDFPMTANSNEAFRIAFASALNNLYYDVESGVGGGVLRLNINIQDWQGIYNGNISNEISSITLKSPDLFTADATPALQSETGTVAFYYADLTGLAVPSRPGLNQLICEVVSSDGTTYKQAVPPAPEVAVAAYNIFPVEVMNPECTGDANNDWNEAVGLPFGEAIPDQVCLSSDYKDFYFFDIPAAYEASGSLRLLCEGGQTTLGLYTESQILITETPVASGNATINLENLNLLPGHYFVRVLTSNATQVVPYVIELTGSLSNVTPLNPVEVTPDDLYCNVRTIDFHNNYLYMTGWSGLFIYDVTNPANPTMVSRSQIYGIENTALYYPYLYYTSNSGSTESDISVIDLTNPLAPINYPSIVHFVGHKLEDVAINSAHLYVGTEGSTDSEVIIYDWVTSPTTPVELNRITITNGKPQILDLLDPEGPDTKLIVGTGNDLKSFNVENPTAVTATGTYTFPSGAPRGITIEGNYVYVGYDSTGGGEGWLYSFYQGTNTINKIGDLDTPGSAYHIASNSSYVYLADGLSGLTICNVTTPSTPSFVSSTSLISYALDLVINGDYVYIIPQDAGMQVIKVDTPLSPAPVARLMVVNTVYSFAQKGNYLICAEMGNQTFGAFKVVDISDPDNVYVADDIYPGFKPNILSLEGDIMVSANQDKSWSVLNVADPLNITTLHQHPESDYIYELSIHGNAVYVYLSNPSTPLKIYDISTPSAPSYQWTITFPNGVSDISYYGNYMYVASGANVEVYSILDPFHPTSVGSYSYSVWGYYDTDIQGDKLYALSRETLEIASLSAPDSPAYLGGMSLPTPNTSYNALDVDGQFAYIGGYSEKLYSVQVFPPSNPALIGEVNQDLFCTARELLSLNGYLYQAAENQGLRVYDLY